MFSINGVGGEIPIEDQSDLLLGYLYKLVLEMQTPEAAADVLNQFQNGSRKRGGRRKKSTT